jgi:hypothetical protein
MEYKHLLYSLFVCILQVEKSVVLLCLPHSRGNVACDKGVIGAAEGWGVGIRK